MKKPNTLHEYQAGIYPRKVWIIKRPDKDFIKSAFLHEGSRNPIDITEAENSSLCVVFDDAMEVKSRALGCLVCIFGNLRVKEIAHEAYHVSASILTQIGSYPNTEDQEPTAFFIGEMAEYIDQVNKNKFKD